MVYSIDISSSVQLEPPLPVQNVVGFPVSTLSFSGQVEAIMGWAAARQSKVVCVSNVHMLMEGHWQSNFSTVLSEADLLTPDGMPLVWVASLMKGSSQERVAGMELMQALCDRAQASDVSIFFLGAEKETLDRIRVQLTQDFPQLKVAGMISPPFHPLSVGEDEEIVRHINQSGSGLVFVSLGCPKQEKWMSAHKEKVQAVMVGLGGAFPVYAGIQQWAPKWVRNNGLEWLYRLLQEPKRLWRRYAQTIPPFLWLAAKQLVKARLGISPEISLRKKHFGPDGASYRRST